MEYTVDKSGALPDFHLACSVPGGLNHCRPLGRYLNVARWITLSTTSPAVSIMEAISGMKFAIKHTRFGYDAFHDL